MPWDGAVQLFLVVLALIYTYALVRRWSAGAFPPMREPLCFYAGWSVVVLALASPLDVVSDVLFVAHMTQHELLMLVAAPLVVLGRPLIVLPWAMPNTLRHRAIGLWRRSGAGRIWSISTGPVVALVVHGLVVWIAHVPVLFETALAHEGLHALQHFLFFWSAALFWWALVHGRYGRLGYGVSVLFVFVTALHTSLLGALLTVSPTPWYQTHAARVTAGGGQALDDQQLAGLVMWVPAGALLTLVGLALFGAWLGESDRRARVRSPQRRGLGFEGTYDPPQTGAGGRATTHLEREVGTMVRRARRRFVSGAALLVACPLVAACGRQSTSTAAQTVSTSAPTASAARGEAPDDDGQWVMPSKTHDATRFSGLTEIDADNVKRLQSVWTFSTGVLQGHEAAPLVVGDTMYLVTPYPNILYALDLNGGSGRLKWKYEPSPHRAAQGVACCDVVNRGAAYADGKIVYNTLDNRTIAVDAASGRLLWSTTLGDINRGESMTMAPLIAKNKVLVGNSGGEFGVRGWLTALNLSDGSIAWRAYSTGPDRDVLIGSEFKPYYEQDRGKDLGVTTWPPEMWTIGGGAVWGWISYDPALNLIYYGTSNPGPWNPEQRPGDNKWTAAVFARDVDTGMARWAYQWSPHDKFDYDGVNENVLLDLEIGGRLRQVLVRPDRNGFLYVLDRMTGEVISADPFAYTTVATGVDLKTGRPIEVESKSPGFGRTVRDICPAAPGGKDWQPSSWSPVTRLLYIPHNHLCMDMEGTQANYIAGTPFVGARVVMKAGPGGHRGEFTAWDPVARKAVWKIKERFPAWSGALATAGGVVFYGTMDRWFKAVDARTGQLLWQQQVGSGIIGQPITYRGPDGRQYVAVFSGVGGWSGAVVAGGLDPRDPTAALGFVGATGDLPDYTAAGGTLHVFALPQEKTS